MTKETKKQRINQALEATTSLLKKELSYSTHLQNNALITTYNLHFTKLWNMLHVLAD